MREAMSCAYIAAIEAAIIEAEKGVFVSGTATFAWLEELKSNPQAPKPVPDIQKHHP